MNLQEKNSTQKLESDEPYDVMHGLNIKFDGLLTLELIDKYANKRQALNEYLSKYTNDIHCQKVNHIGTIYQIHCENDNKSNAIVTIKDFLSVILIREEIKHLKACININLSSLNFKDENCIDYDVMKLPSFQLFDVLPKLLEPVEPQLIVWDGKTWPDTPY